MTDNEYKDYTAVLRIASGQDAETDFVLIEHAYSKPFSWNPGLSSGRLRKTLFISRIVKEPNVNIDNDEIDIVTVAEPFDPVPYDIDKAKHVMNECERHVRGISQSEDDMLDDEDNEEETKIWDEKVDRTNWSAAQHETFESVVKILDCHHLARLALSGTPNEPVKRRAVVDKAAAKFRRLFARLHWDNKLTHWLHGCLLQNLTPSYLAAYIDVLQTLKSKIPTLVDKMIALAVLPKTPRVEALNLLLKRPWDPALPSLNQSKPKKLEKMPIIIIVPNGASSPNLPQASRRNRFFNTQLQHLAKSIPINVSATPELWNAKSILDSILHEVKTKVVECRRQFPGRPIVLLGWGIGAILAAMVSLNEKVEAMVLLGFPMQSHVGKRGEADDILLDVTTPSLFIIGSKAVNTSIDDVEDFRHRLKAITSLVVISDAEATLKISNKKQYWEGLTQSMVDRCIVDEIGDFLSSILCDEIKNPPLAVQPANLTVEIPTTAIQKPRISREVSRKRKMSPLSLDNTFQMPSKVFRAGTNLSQQLGLKIPVGSIGNSSQQTSEAGFSSTIKSHTNDSSSETESALRKDTIKTEIGASFLGNLLSNPPTKERSRSPHGVSKHPSASSVTTISIGGLASVSKQRYQSLFQATEEAYEDTDEGRDDFVRQPQTATIPVTLNKRGRPPTKHKGVGRAVTAEAKPVKHYGRGRPPNAGRTALVVEKEKVPLSAANEDTSMAVLTFTAGATDSEAQDKIEGLSTVGRGFLTLGRGGGTSSVRVFSTNSNKLAAQKTNQACESSPVIKISSGTASSSIAGPSSIKSEATKNVPETRPNISTIVYSDKGAEVRSSNSKLQQKTHTSVSSLPQISIGQLPVSLQGIPAARVVPAARSFMPKTTISGKSTVMLVTSSTSATPLSSIVTKSTMVQNKDNQEIILNQAKTESTNVSFIDEGLSVVDSQSQVNLKVNEEKIKEFISQPSQASPVQLTHIKTSTLGKKGDSLFVVASKSTNTTTMAPDMRPIVVSSKPGVTLPSFIPSSNQKIAFSRVLQTGSMKVASQNAPTQVIKPFGSDRIKVPSQLKQNMSEVVTAVSTATVNPVISAVVSVNKPITQSGIVTKKVIISKKISKEQIDSSPENISSPLKLGGTDDPGAPGSFSKLSPAEELNLVLGQTADALNCTMTADKGGRKVNIRLPSKPTMPQGSTAKKRLSEIKVSITTPGKSHVTTEVKKSFDSTAVLSPITETKEVSHPDKVTPKTQKQSPNEDVSRVTRSTKVVGPTRSLRHFRSSI